MLERCTRCGFIIAIGGGELIGARYYHRTCAKQVMADRRFPKSKDILNKIKENIHYLSVCDPVEVYKNEERLQRILDSFGFELDESGKVKE